MQPICSGSIKTCRNPKSQSIATSTVFFRYTNIIWCPWSISCTKHSKLLDRYEIVKSIHLMKKWLNCVFFLLFLFVLFLFTCRCVKRWNECIRECIWISHDIYREHHLVSLKKLILHPICWMLWPKIYSKVVSIGRKLCPFLPYPVVWLSISYDKDIMIICLGLLKVLVISLKMI